MKRYFWGFVLTYAVSAAVFLGLLGVVLYNWFFGGTPAWFYVLCIILVMLPFPVGGKIIGSRMRERVGKPGKMFFILLGAMLLTGIAGAFLFGETSMLAFPGALIGAALEELLYLNLEEIFTVVAQTSFALLFHLGWKMGQRT